MTNKNDKEWNVIQTRTKNEMLRYNMFIHYKIISRYIFELLNITLHFLKWWSTETGAFLGMGGEHKLAEVGLGGFVCRLTSFSSNAQVPGVLGLDITFSGISSTISTSFVSVGGPFPSNSYIWLFAFDELLSSKAGPSSFSLCFNSIEFSFARSSLISSPSSSATSLRR